MFFPTIVLPPTVSSQCGGQDITLSPTLDFTIISPTFWVGVKSGYELKDQLKHSGFTQETLGFEAGLRRTYISSLKLREKKPTLTTIFKLASALNTPAADRIKTG
jgi:hypothetical protein